MLGNGFKKTFFLFFIAVVFVFSAYFAAKKIFHGVTASVLAPPSEINLDLDNLKIKNINPELLYSGGDLSGSGSDAFYENNVSRAEAGGRGER
jgi:hypothetical protein